MEKSDILKNYAFIKKLGKGSFGEVMLMQDLNGRFFAIKLISKQHLEERSLENLNSEIFYMKSCNSRHIAKLYDHKQDDQFYYLFCQYCNEGDLFSYQAKQPNKTFSVDQTTQILSSVIRGLHYMHQGSVLHRDIKPQNILVSKDDKGIMIFKLADLGFSKHQEQVLGTILGTQKFMSPEVFARQPYGFQVDMWAFGVTMYFMLNMQYPFNINPHILMEERTHLLKQLACNFSYRKAVEKSKKKLLEKCSNGLEDLFKQIFDVDADRRITFSQIRQHPVFKKHFPEGGVQSAILYKKKMKFQPNKLGMSKIMKPSSVIMVKKKKTVAPEFNVIDVKHSRLQFLKETEIEIKKYSSGVLTPSEALSLRYLLIKIYLKYYREFINELTPDNLKKTYPDLDWKNYCDKSDFGRIVAKYESEYSGVEMDLSNIYELCSNYLPQIQKIEEHYKLFPSIYQEQPTQARSGKKLLEMFSYAIRHCYKIFSQKQKQDSKYSYLCFVLLICVVFRKLFPDNQKNIQKVLSIYNETRKHPDQPIDFNQFRIWANVSSPQTLRKLQDNVTNQYLHKSH